MENNKYYKMMLKALLDKIESLEKELYTMGIELTGAQVSYDMLEKEMEELKKQKGN